MKDYLLFHKDTTAFIYGYHANVIQRMLDFDYVCQRAKPSIAAIINPNDSGYHKAFFGAEEILIPMYRTIEEAARNHQNADVMVNFASFRSAYPTTMEALNQKTIRTVAVIAEGVPERRTRELIAVGHKNNKVIIGPATVGGIAAGAFRIGNTGGMIDNIIAAKLHRPGSVGLVSKSGGMLNELFNMVASTTNGVFEGMAVGGDRYPGSTLLEHCLRYEANPDIKMIVVLGEVGGADEYELAEALEKNKISKPLVFWSIGTCAKIFPTSVQFGHAGAMAHGKRETADAKNDSLKSAGAVVPDSYDDFPQKIKAVFEDLKKKREIPDIKEPEVPKIPMDYSKALKEGLIRKQTSFTSTICDDRGPEHSYVGIPITKVFEENMSLGDVISLLWFKRRLPHYASKFIEMVLMIVADHGPAVSGAHNAIIAARAGKDLVSSLASGLLTIGPRFGGAMDDAARCFKRALDNGKTPEQFVNEMKAAGILIPGIGHRVRSKRNPDKRVELLKNYAKEHFPKTELLDYALKVEEITTAKRDNLILNVDGCVGILFVDLLSSSGMFAKEEVNEVIEAGCLNGLFVLGRSIGLMGHVFDQKRLKAGLYRHPWDDILYG